MAVSASAQSRSLDFARAVALYFGLQGRVMWVDATANLSRITTPEGVRDIVSRCKKAGFTTIVVDCKPISGEVVYDSRIAPRLRSWKGQAHPAFDALAAFVEEGHRAGLEIMASVNVLSEGHKYFSVGPAYRHPEWQSISYVVDRQLAAPDGARLPVRGDGEPEDPARTLVHDASFVVQPSERAGGKLAVAIDGEGRVAGMIDPALLGEEPLTTPEDGQMLVLEGKGVDWAGSHLRPGGPARFEASGKRVPVTQAATEKVAAFVNPLVPEVRAYELSLLREIVTRYEVDGVLLDRMRYANIYNDYSDRTRAAFERWLGAPTARWPEDVIEFRTAPGAPPRRGPLYRRWLEFRARVIRDFAREACEAIRAARPSTRVGAYVGSWFTQYYGVGVNWGSEKYPVRAGWATPTYNTTGYAELLDLLCTGCYYPVPTREEARAAGRQEGGTVEAAAELSMRAVANGVPLYAGLYALNYEGRPQDFARAVSVAAARSEGVMVFDVSYIYDYDWWPILEGAFTTAAIPPHDCDDLTAQLRAAYDAVRAGLEVDAVAARLPVVPYQSGGG